MIASGNQPLRNARYILAEHFSRKARSPRKGIGLYTYEQSKSNSPFQYVVQIVVGVIISVLATASFYEQLLLRAEEIRRFGSAESRLWNWIGELIWFGVGVFIAHAGIIFYCRRFFRWISKSRRDENNSTH